MKIQKRLVLLFAIFFTSGVVFANNSFEGASVKIEAQQWMDEIKKWDVLHKNWYENRKKIYDELFGEKFTRTDGEYCDDIGCFEEGIFDVAYKSGKKSFEFSSMGDFELSFNNLKLQQLNSGQDLKFENLDNGENWSSSNFGQVLNYKDQFGNVWESSNIGQFIKYNGIDGSTWESNNYGQSLVFKNGKGKAWESNNMSENQTLNNDTVDTESVDFDVQDDLFNF